MKDFIKEKLRTEIENILTPPAPRDAAEHGGIKDWEYYYNKQGMEYMLDRIMELFEEHKQNLQERLEKEKVPPPDEMAAEVVDHARECFNAGIQKAIDIISE